MEKSGSTFNNKTLKEGIKHLKKQAVKLEAKNEKSRTSN